jgi:uncharacterized membrane protein YoaK (UPF0700 family)
MKYFLMVLIFVGGIILGGFLGKSYFNETIVDIVPLSPVIETKIVYRDYNKSVVELKKDLQCYDMSEPFLDLKHIKEKQVRAEAKLCEREWHRDFELNVKTEEETDWKTYAIIIVVSLLVGAAAGGTR